MALALEDSYSRGPPHGVWGVATAARVARCSVEPWSGDTDHDTSCRPSTAPEACAAAFATHASAAMHRGGGNLAPPPELRPRPTTACRYPTVFKRLQPPQSRPMTPAERLQRTDLQRSVSAQTLLDNKLRQDMLTKLGYSLPQRAISSSTLATETIAGSALGTGAPPLLPCRLTLAYGQAATPAVAVTPSRTPLPPRAAWNDVRPPPDEQGPWRAMLLAANWSNCVEDETEPPGGEESLLGGRGGNLGEAGSRSGEASACAQGAREMGRHMREAGFGRGRHMRAAMWD